MYNSKINYYIFVTPNISFIGGAELYIKRKCEYLVRNNCIPLIITGNNSNILIFELNKYKQLMIEELMFSPIFFSLKKQKKIIAKIVNWIKSNCNQSNNIIVESHDMSTTLWSELIAEKLKIINFSYFLSDVELKKMSTIYQEFAKFKLDRKELIAITEKSMQVMFENIKNIDKSENNYINIPFGKDEIIKNDNLIMSFLNNIDRLSFVISTVSRLEKGYLHKLIESVGKIAKKNSNNVFVLIIVGDSKDKNLLDKFKKKYKFVQKNLDVIFTGYINPLPKILFKRTHIFVGMGTSVINSISQGCATICFDRRTNLSAGILGLNLRNFAYNDREKENTLEYDINKLLYNKKLLKEAKIKGEKLFKEEYSNEIVMKKFMDLVNDRLKYSERKYFNIVDFKDKFCLKEKAKIYIFKIFGQKGYLYLIKDIIIPLKNILFYLKKLPSLKVVMVKWFYHKENMY
ncbi:hypothetical protein ES704_00056 [subsurface metagenome]|jgi:glycosyltransferase involved in cell wall biosynthesis